MYADLFARAQNALGQTQGQTYGGDFVAQATPQFFQGVDMLNPAVARAQALQGQDQGAIDLLKATVGGQYLSPENNPFLKAAAANAVDRVREPLMNQVLPSISDQSIAQGAYGGARQDLAQGAAVRDFDRAALDASNQLYYQNYGAERQNQLAAAPALQSAIQSSINLAQQPAAIQLQIGDLLRGANQLTLDNAQQRFQESITAPWRGLAEAAGLYGAGGFGTTTTGSTGGTTGSSSQTNLQNLINTLSGTTNTTKDNPNYESPFLQLLKAGVGVASGVAGIGGSQGFGLWGAAPKAA
jgi:hypothetical protein